MLKAFSLCQSVHESINYAIIWYFFSNVETSTNLEQHVIVYNPLAWNITTYINISIKYPMALVFDDNGLAVPAQVLFIHAFIHSMCKHGVYFVLSSGIINLSIGAILIFSIIYECICLSVVCICGLTKVSSIMFYQIQPSADSPAEYDLFVMVELGGLQFKKYLIQFPQSKCKQGSSCGLTYAARVVTFERRSVSQWKKTGRFLLPVLNECYKLFFDQETNLLHIITNRWAHLFAFLFRHYEKHYFQCV